MRGGVVELLEDVTRKLKLTQAARCLFTSAGEAIESTKLIEEGVIREGMIPKVECCIDALAGGVARTHIVDGRILHAILLEIFTDDSGVGTLLTP